MQNYTSSEQPVYLDESVYSTHQEELGFGYDGRFERSTQSAKYQDPLFAIVFLLHIVAIGVVFFISVSRHDLSEYEGLVPHTSQRFLPLMLKAFAASSASAIVLGYFSLIILGKYPYYFIHASMILNIVFMLVMAGVFAFVLKLFWTLFIWLLFVALWVFVYWSIIPLIPFLCELLTTVTDLIRKYPSTIGLNVVSVVFQYAWIMFFSFLLLNLQSKFSHKVVTGLTVWLLLSFYWTLQVIRNVVHTANCGVFASWYFLSGTSDMPQSPMIGSIKRTLTTSFGSVAFGSLIVAAIQTLRTLVRSGNSHDACQGLMDCLLSFIESIARYINHYAFVTVATYGKSYLDAARSTWDVFERTGLINLVNDTVLSKLQFAVCCVMAIILGAGGAGLTYLMGLGSQYVSIVAGSCFVGGWLVTSLIMQTIESGASTIYVCFAEDSRSLQRTNPALYDRILSTFGGQIVASSV